MPVAALLAPNISGGGTWLAIGISGIITFVLLVHG